MDEHQWLFVVQVSDRVGAAHSVASVFFNRGISMDMIVGVNSRHSPSGTGTVVISFRAHPAKKEIIKRTLTRLSKVHSLQEYTLDSDRLRQTAMIRVKTGEEVYRILNEIPVITDRIEQGSEETSLLLIGPPSEVENALAKLKEKNLLLNAFYTVIAI